MALLTLVAILYLGIVALVGVLTGLGAPLEVSMRTGFAVGRVGAALVAVLDLLTLLGGHRPSEVVTHVAYAGCALLLPSLLASRAVVRGAPSPWVVAGACVATAVVLVRLAQTWG